MSKRSQVDAVCGACTQAIKSGATCRWRSALPCCAAPPMRWRRTAAVLRAAGQRGAQDLGDAWPRCARRWTSSATTPTRPQRIMQPHVTAGVDRRDQHPAPARPRRVGLHQSLELPAGDLCRPGGRGAGGRQHRAAKPAEQTPGVAAGCGGPAACGRCAGAMPCSCCTARAKPWARRWWRSPAWRACVHRLHPGGQNHQPRAGRERRPDRAADRRDRRHQRHAGRQHRAARAGGRRGGAERLPQRRPALLGAAPAVRARGALPTA